MKQKKTRYPYLSGRILTLAAGLGFALLSLSLLLLVQAGAGRMSAVWGLILFFISQIAGLSFVFWILRPYRASERMLARYQDGKAMGDPVEERLILSTPETRHMLLLLQELWHSPQMMDLNRRQAQYLALQNQINPHFLYNTLESIRGEALIAGLDSVAEMTEALARFFRYTITKVENLVSVEEEVDNCETYFEIQKYRFGDRLQLHINSDAEDWEEIMNCRIPKLTLQPILENSIIHGTELKIGTGNLYLHFARTQDRLLIRISDDGVGMDEETLAKLNRKLGRSRNTIASEERARGGIALENVNNRIQLIFGDEYGMHIDSAPQRGTDVEITLPFVTKDSEVRNRGVLT